MHLKVLIIWRLHFNAVLKTSIKDKLILRFSSGCFEPHFHFGLRWLNLWPIKSHTCSIGFMPGDIADHGIVWTASCCKKCCTIRALCGLALSSMNIGLSVNAWLWRRINLSDESRFLFRPTDGCARVWRQRNTSFQDNHILGATAFEGGGVTVWGCFSFDCKLDLYVLDGNLTGQK
jgi:hypothetical protein